MSHVKRTHYDHRTFFLRTYLICRYSFMCPLINLKRDVCPFKGRTVDASLKVSHNMKTQKKYVFNHSSYLLEMYLQEFIIHSWILIISFILIFFMRLMFLTEKYVICFQSKKILN